MIDGRFIDSNYSEDDLMLPAVTEIINVAKFLDTAIYQLFQVMLARIVNFLILEIFIYYFWLHK